MSTRREAERELLLLKAEVHRRAIRHEFAGLRDDVAALSPVKTLFKGAMLLIGAGGIGSRKSWLLRVLPVAMLLLSRFKKSRNKAD
ncbi:MAG TPA: hypothetical protein VFW00_04485 [Rhodocyclaceae bacterium]|nr:hypothetical protein [Rhodocyclaceae bacterium]